MLVCSIKNQTHMHVCYIFFSASEGIVLAGQAFKGTGKESS